MMLTDYPLRILGIDPSETHTGLALVDGKSGKVLKHETLAYPACKGIPRLYLLYRDIRTVLKCWDPAVSVIEGYAYGKFAKSHQLGEVGGMIRLEAYKTRHDLYVVAPASMKKFVTGYGLADKKQVLLSIRKRWGAEFPDDHQTDAFGLAMIGRELSFSMRKGHTRKSLKDYEQAAVETILHGESNVLREQHSPEGSG